MTYETRIAQARALIEAFNASGTAGAVDFDLFEAQLKSLGACTDGTLAMVSWEDLQACGLPKLLARQVAGELRGAPEKSDYLSQKKVDRMRFEELIERYNPREDDLVARKLKGLSGGKRFVVFNAAAGVVDLTATLRLLQEIKRGLGEVSITSDSLGSPARVYKVGEVPNDELDENPLYPGRALRTDETCDQTLRSWKGIPLDVRQIVYLAITQTHEVQVKVIGDAHELMDRCIPAGKDSVAGKASALAMRWPHAALLYIDLKEKGQLPRLMVAINRTPSSGNPFYQG